MDLPDQLAAGKLHFLKKGKLGMHLKRKIVAATLLTMGMAWSGASYACSSEPFVGSICIMASPKPITGYRFANGDLLAIAANPALFSIIGSTFGGDGRTTFGLPDLRGRTVIGAGLFADAGSSLNYDYGKAYGLSAAALRLEQLPPHSHGFTSLPMTLSGDVDTNAASFTTTYSSAPSLDLQLMAAAPTAGTPPPDLTNVPSTSTTLGSTTSAVKIYSSNAPSIKLHKDSIKFAFAPGQMKTEMTGKLAMKNVVVTGEISKTGGSALVSKLPPSLALTYQIAVIGLYPPFE
ncbi:tail fiber protein [Massilia sp. MB5]|uniref:phage tail protein n=1 Tax=Massilia sp. MB5 TaxID=2919578 RepID=UPI001F0F6880|nr:tail fiber protein [Massilia sp. MB5]UMR31407.1 tail fiber protein [Massilia sp. MB5]